MRYFLEVAYKGTAYAGFQVQNNAETIQSKIEDALKTFYRKPFQLTGSSRTDAGVHALQNFFHVDTDVQITSLNLYNINSILPGDIVIRSARLVKNSSHSRFDALTREYKYFMHTSKDPFARETSWLYSYPLNFNMLQEAALAVKNNVDFSSFSKRNVQVNNFRCTIQESKWVANGDALIYNVKANRFLRGMVRALVATMLKVGRGRLSMEQLTNALAAEKSTDVDFSAPAHGLFLVAVEYPKHYFEPVSTL